MVNMTASAGNFVSHFKTERRLAESACQEGAGEASASWCKNI